MVTGAARGLGKVIARRFLAEGANVVINDVDAAAGRAAAHDLGTRAVACDVSDSAAVADMVAEAHESLGRLDILVNNAGISPLQLEDSPARWTRKIADRARQAESGEAIEPLDWTRRLSDEAWRRMLAVHLDGTFFCSREALKIMTPQSGGSIVNMASVMGTYGRLGFSSYAAAKGGILGFTRALAHEVADRNIRVNAIAPGWVETEMFDNIAIMHDRIRAATPLGRFGSPEDIASAAVYLAGDESGFVTGQTLSPNGGWYMSQ